MKNVVVVSKDVEYVALIEYRIAEVFDEKAEINILTSDEIIEQYFMQPRKIDLLIVDEELFDEKIEKQNPAHVFLVTVDNSKKDVDKGNIHFVLKYNSIKFLLEKMEKYFDISTKISSAKTKVISVYSIAAQHDRTVSALGISYMLAKRGGKVLYINTDSLQDFGFFLRDNKYLSDSMGISLGVEGENIVAKLLMETNKYGFDYIPPLSNTLESYKIDLEKYAIIIEAIKNRNIFDYIIVDLPSNIMPDTMSLLCSSDRIVMLTKQDELSLFRISKFMKCITNIDGKCVMVVKNYDRNQRNALLTSDIVKIYPICEYISQESMNIEVNYSNGLYEKTMKALI